MKIDRKKTGLIAGVSFGLAIAIGIAMAASLLPLYGCVNKYGFTADTNTVGTCPALHRTEVMVHIGIYVMAIAWPIFIISFIWFIILSIREDKKSDKKQG